ncbi:MAG: helix-turn-helix domain-containing protein [Candidatus Paceibacterota bacterium]|jgi:sugar-specific transcriptional regulator TrmB
MLNKILATIGLTDEEIKTYLSLLETGPITVGNLAKKTGKARASLYGFLKKLQTRGAIIQSLKSGVKTFSAEPPVKIGLLFRQKIEELQDNERLYKDLLPSLERGYAPKLLAPKIQVFDDKKSLQNIMMDILLYRDIECQTFWPIKTMVEILSPDFFRYFNKKRIKENIYTRSIWPINQSVSIKDHAYLGVGKEFKREIRLAPKEIDFSTGYLLYEDKALFLSSRKESFGFIIESAEFTKMMKSQFEAIWKLSKTLTVSPKDTESFLKEINK